jgi:hypothetical protein
MDKRDEILESTPGDFTVWTEGHREYAKKAMDEYMRLTCLELLEYMARQQVDCREDDDGNPIFIVGPVLRSKELTKEQLFENFL